MFGLGFKLRKNALSTARNNSVVMLEYLRMRQRP